MIRFGPAGFSGDFAEKYNSTELIPDWLINHELGAYEYSFTNGIRLSDETAIKYGKLFKEKNIELSIHAPYFINFANPDELMIEKSINYIITSLKKMKLLGAKKLVFHPGSLLKLSRDEAFSNTYNNIKNLVEVLKTQNDLPDEYYICPETMGKHGQVGTVEEIAKICTLDEHIIPTLDFGHINAFTLGTLKTEKDYENVFLLLKKYLGDRYKKVHIHFSKIEYGSKGEIRHLTFEDDRFGPEFEPLAKVLKKHNIDACIISESAGTQTLDAIIMKNIYNKILSY